MKKKQTKIKAPRPVQQRKNWLGSCFGTCRKSFYLEREKKSLRRKKMTMTTTTTTFNVDFFLCHSDEHAELFSVLKNAIPKRTSGKKLK